jgi:hypothetical protein
MRLLGLSGQATIGELIYKFKTKGLPANSEIEAMRQEFKTYQYQPKLQPWLAEATNS